jgi:nucleotide-binding universal stress UspA family protein
MCPMRNILVPLDGSGFAESALPMALDIARRAAAHLTLVSVHTPMPSVGLEHGAPALDPDFENEQRADIRTYLDTVCRRVATEAEQTAGVAAVVLDGPVAESLAEYAERVGADLVVLTSHGRGGASRFWLGSVTDALVRRLAVPALVVRPAAGPTPPSGAFRRVLVPIDGTPESALGADTAVAILGTVDVEYTALRVLSAVPRRFASFVSIEGGQDDAADQRDFALRDLAAVERGLRDHGADVRGVVRFHGSPAAAIVEYAAEARAGLIAIATHGRGPVGRLLFGGVTDKVLRTATVPVLVRHIGERRGGEAASGAGNARVRAADVSPPGTSGIARPPAAM